MPDFGFVGTSYTTPSIYQDGQECINFFAEIDPTKQPGDRGIVALYPTPGLFLQTQLTSAEVRGLHTMSGEQILIAVAGQYVYQVNTSMVATQIGTLTTNTGQVSISDNIDKTNGLTAYIVDGPNRYTWVVATNLLQLCQVQMAHGKVHLWLMWWTTTTSTTNLARTTGVVLI